MLKIIVRRWKMPNYLTKEDIKRWRSSLERCTLEQYAEKLGKVIQNEKETCDIIDIVFDKNHEDPFTIKHDDAYTNRYNGEKITSDLNLVNIRKKPLNIVKPEMAFPNKFTKSKSLILAGSTFTGSVKITPSNTHKGAVLPNNVVVPRILILGAAPTCPLFCIKHFICGSVTLV